MTSHSEAWIVIDIVDFDGTFSFVFLSSSLIFRRLGTRMYLGLAASDLHVLSSFHSLNALPMYIHYTSDSLSVAWLSLAYWQNTSDMCFQVKFDTSCSQNGQLSKQWTIATN